MVKGNAITKVSDKAIMGKEPVISAESSRVDILNALNWYNYFYTNADAKSFHITYLKNSKADKDVIEKISKLPNHMFATVGWFARMMNQGGTLPIEQMTSFMQKASDLTYVEDSPVEVVEDANNSTEIATTPTISIQQRTANKASALAGELEGEIDVFIEGKKNDFDLKNWFIKNEVKPQVGKLIAEKFQPLYEQVFDALEGKDEELVWAYRLWKKPILKAYMEFLKEIIGLAEERDSIAKAQRAPRKRKEKPAGVLASKLKFMPESEEYGIKSQPASDIIKSEQAWFFDTKTRNLFVFNAMGPAGLGIKGTKITGFDAKTSFGKKLRKPEGVIKSVLEGGKVKLRKLLDEINAKPKATNGRITESFVILRVI